MHRLAALARDAVLARGGDPVASIALLRERGLATLLVRKGGFTPGEVACLAGIAARDGFTVEALPGRPAATPLARVVAGQDPWEGRFDLSPPTDDRPFFYNDVPRARFFSLLLTPGEAGAVGRWLRNRPSTVHPARDPRYHEGRFHRARCGWHQDPGVQRRGRARASVPAGVRDGS